jgi:LysM repeat protein
VAAPSTAAPSNTKKVMHTVVSGDTASGIAAKYGVSTRDFLAWNKLTTRSVLKLGKKYVVHTASDSGPAATATPASPTPSANQIIHVVAKGENPTVIARKFKVRVSDLFKWNQWPNKHVLHIGDKVIINKP